MPKDQSLKRKVDEAIGKNGEAWPQYGQKWKRQKTSVLAEFGGLQRSDPEVLSSESVKACAMPAHRQVDAHPTPSTLQQGALHRNETVVPALSIDQAGVRDSGVLQQLPNKLPTNAYQRSKLDQHGDLLVEGYSNNSVQRTSLSPSSLRCVHQTIDLLYRSPDHECLWVHRRHKIERLKPTKRQLKALIGSGNSIRLYIASDSIDHVSTSTVANSVTAIAPHCTHRTALATRDPAAQYEQSSDVVRSPQVPQTGTYSIMNNYDSQDYRPYVELLESLGDPICKFGSKDTGYTRLEPQPYLREMNTKDDGTVLARCIRYAQSHAQQQLSWILHPIHVALIVERTNQYDIELVPPPEEKDVDERDLSQRLRLENSVLYLRSLDEEGSQLK
ncbi:hypothetical protein CC86DRAFT_411562 [Ophiobolus disseminans]|uniref:Uncharacterized protein n=1 Tax=Ophiobolus disseminans TaxID=1469910 RepID=A0A6A6ZM04_9PLEO|nr:hypothetical protein CC86DRAFT_411562 [Ophiobolus disseminans]